MKFQLLDTEKFKQTIPYPPRNYWDFPVVSLTFCESLSYSRPVWFHDCLFRDAGKKGLTLVSYKDGASIQAALADSSLKIQKSMVYMDPELPQAVKVHGSKTLRNYWVGREYLEKIENNHFHAQSIRNGRNKGRKLFNISPLQATEWPLAVDVFNRWREDAAKRHFMVTVGHYLRWMNFARSDKIAGTHMLLVKCSEGGLAVGLSGYEVYGDYACIVIMKTAPAHNSLPAYIWLHTIDYILKNHPNVNKIFCGDTADGLKTRLELNHAEYWRIL